MGTNILAGTQKNSILTAYYQSLQKDYSEKELPPKWDGHAAERIWDTLLVS